MTQRIDRRPWSRGGTGLLLFGLLLQPLLAGCDMTRFTARSSAGLFERAAPAFDEQSDYEFAKQAAPASIMQLEGILRIEPEDPRLLLAAAQAWTSYAYGFVEEELEVAEQRGDLQGADHQRARARRMYLHAHDLGRRWLLERASGTERALSAGPDRLRDFLVRELDDESDAKALFWTGYSWGEAIDISRDDPALMADLPLARTLVEHSVKLDERYYGAAGHIFLGCSHATLSPALGGDPKAAHRHFERALALTRRTALMVQVNYARCYAVQTQNRPLFLSLLQETSRASIDLNPQARLPNEIARRRATRLLARVDELFPP
jgi:hypothetical protein